MHEILFRGKDIRGKWHYGLLAHINNSWYISNRAGALTAFEVFEDTIGQYVGFEGKDGKKIFEDDIVLFGFEPCVVKYDTENARFMFYKYGGYVMNGLNADTVSIKEVIGNIHDNPELILKYMRGGGQNSGQ